ncbi:MAG: hypothetical protein ACHQF2_05705 [Flavobacteriales bacterium]
MKNVFRFRSGLLLLPFIAILVTSCSKKTVEPGEAAKNLISSKEPVMLVSLSIKSILDKGGISNYENVPLMVRPLMGDKMNMFVKPDATGLDFAQKSYMLFYPGSPEPEMIMISKVTDKDKATSFLADSFETEPQDNDGYSYIIDETVQAWNDKLFIVASIKGGKEEKLKRMSEIFETAAESKGSPKKIFTNVLESKKDIAMCISQVHAMEMGGQKAGEEASRILKDCYTVVTAAFENGKISVKMNAELTALAKKEMNFFSKGGLPESYKSYMGINEPWAAIGINMNFDSYYTKVMNFIPEVVREQLEREMGMDITTDPQIKNMIGGLGEHIMISVSKGESVVSNETSDEKKYSYKPTIIGVIELKGDLLKTMLDSALAKFRKDGYYSFSDESSPDKAAFLFLTKDNAAIFTNSQAVLNELKTKGSLTKTSLSVAGHLFEYPIAGFADFNQAKDEIGKYDEAAGSMLTEFESVSYFGSTDEMTFEMNFKSKDKNGLWILLNTAKKASTDMMKKRFMPSL